MISDFLRDANYIVGLLGCHARYIGLNYRRFRTTYQFHLKGTNIPILLDPCIWNRSVLSKGRYL